MEISTLGCAALVRLENGRVDDLRLAFGVAAPRQFGVKRRKPLPKDRSRMKSCIRRWRNRCGANYAPFQLARISRISVANRRRADPPRGTRSRQTGKGRMSMLKMVRFYVNGKPVQIALDEREALLDTLRDRLGLTSVKRGCEVGECGACTVLIDCKSTDSCIYLAVWAEGKHILKV